LLALGNGVIWRKLRVFITLNVTELRSKSVKVIIAFESGLGVDEGQLCELLKAKGERTFKDQGDNRWYHERYGSEINYNCDFDNDLIVAVITGGREYRTVGSYIEWILNNIEDIVDRQDYLNAITVVP
jgi:hypothetical protein